MGHSQSTEAMAADPKHFYLKRAMPDGGRAADFLLPVQSPGTGEDWLARIGMVDGRTLMRGLPAIEFFLHGTIGMIEAEVARLKTVLVQLPDSIADDKPSPAETRVVRLRLKTIDEIELDREDIAAYADLLSFIKTVRLGATPMDTDDSIYQQVRERVEETLAERCAAHRAFCEKVRRGGVTEGPPQAPRAAPTVPAPESSS